MSTTGQMNVRRRHGSTYPVINATALAVAVSLGAARAEQPPAFEIVGETLQKLKDSVVAIMGFQVVPDITTSSLSTQSASGENSDLWMSQLGAGFTWSEEFPLYLEGMIALTRYDPVFIASNGLETRRLPVKWNNAAMTVGIGWDIRLTDHFVLRPIANAAIGYITSDLRILGFVANEQLGTDIDFLRAADLKAWGYGGSLVLDYANYNPEREIDIELRYTRMHLETFDEIATIRGQAEIANLNLWARWRAPISDWTMFERPVRYLLEFTHSEFLGDQRDVLNIERLSSFGLGIEVDTGAKDIILDRTRMVARYLVGENVSGFSLGFAVTFAF